MRCVEQKEPSTHLGRVFLVHRYIISPFPPFLSVVFPCIDGKKLGSICSWLSDVTVLYMRKHTEGGLGVAPYDLLFFSSLRFSPFRCLGPLQGTRGDLLQSLPAASAPAGLSFCHPVLVLPPVFSLVSLLLIPRSPRLLPSLLFPMVGQQHRMLRNTERSLI